MGIYIYKVSGCSSSRCSSLRFCNRGNRPSSSALAHHHHPINLMTVARPILSVHISSEMLCLSTATCWPPACVSSLLLSEETSQCSSCSSMSLTTCCLFTSFHLPSITPSNFIFSLNVLGCTDPHIPPTMITRCTVHLLAAFSPCIKLTYVLVRRSFCRLIPVPHPSVHFPLEL